MALFGFALSARWSVPCAGKRFSCAFVWVGYVRCWVGVAWPRLVGSAHGGDGGGWIFSEINESVKKS